MNSFWEKIAKKYQSGEKSNDKTQHELHMDDHDDYYTNYLIQILKKESLARTPDDLDKLKKFVFNYPEIKNYFADLGVVGKYQSEFVELLKYRFIEEGDPVFQANETHDTFYIILDGLVEMHIDLLCPFSSSEQYLNDAAEELHFKAGQISQEIKTYREKNCITTE